MVIKIAVFKRWANPLKRASKGCKYAKKNQSTLRSEPIIKTNIAKKILENKMSSPEIERLITIVLLQKSWLKTASTEAGIYHFGGASITISGQLSKRYRSMLYAASAFYPTLFGSGYAGLGKEVFLIDDCYTEN